MANKSDLETYIMRCARKYGEQHPDKKIKVHKTIELPITECAYCGEQEPVTDIPFSFSVNIKGKRLLIQDDSEFYGIDINYCPICGREL